MAWSDFKKWWTDLVKSIIVFILVALASYFIIDELNNNREKSFYKWKLSENIYNEVLREFEIAYRSYKINLESTLMHRLFIIQNDSSKERLQQYLQNKDVLIRSLSSLKYWSLRKGINISHEVSSVFRLLTIIDKYPQKHLQLVQGEYSDRNFNQAEQIWYSKRKEKLVPYIDTLEMLYGELLDEVLEISTIK